MEHQDEKGRRRMERELTAPLRPRPQPRILRSEVARRLGAEVEVIQRGR